MEFSVEMKYVLDSFWLLICGCLVMWMAAGFAMLEAGLVRTKNTTAILTKNITLYALACVAYYYVGYNLMYGSGNDFVGSGFMMSGTSADGHSLISDFFFQVVFVATAASIVSGTVAERIKFWPFMGFILVLTAVIYPIQGHWSWGGTSLGGMLDGFSDFAGSTIVHSVGGWAALAGVLLLGARKGKFGAGGTIHPIPGSNLPLATLGTFVLWLGWFQWRFPVGFRFKRRCGRHFSGDRKYKFCCLCGSLGGHDFDSTIIQKSRFDYGSKWSSLRTRSHHCGTGLSKYESRNPYRSDWRPACSFCNTNV